jgi:hypothetical protein
VVEVEVGFAVVVLPQQGVLAAIGKAGEPAKDATDIDAKSVSNALHRLPVTHGLDSLLAHHLQGVMIVGATVGSSFAFHGTS